MNPSAALARGARRALGVLAAAALAGWLAAGDAAAQLLPFASDSRKAAALADSIRHEAGRLAAQGKIEEAIILVDRHAPRMPGVWRSMFEGKLELDGEAAARGYEGAAADTAPEQMRGEALFRLGQYHYAAGRHHLAIPRFRQYLAKYPAGVWSQEAAYWMAYSCLQLATRRSDRAAYLDTALVYLRLIDARGPGAYYWPLARAARARIELARGDSAGAARTLADIRARLPAEEIPGGLLLSLQAAPRAAEATAWEDSLRWNYPLSPEAALLPKPALSAPPPPPREPETRATHALQLGAFAQRENAERFQGELAAKKITARIAVTPGPPRLYRVLAGHYPDAETALREGRRLLTPLGYAFRVVAEP